MRLNKYIALSGVASRRKADKLIISSRVSVNGEIITKLGTVIKQDTDTVLVNGKKCSLPADFVYIALNKPPGYVCTHAVFREEKSIFQLLSKKYRDLKIAGRLDKDSEGLVILSDDGDFIYQLTHPKFEHAKEYEIKTARPLTQPLIYKLKKGVRLEQGLARVDSIKSVKRNVYRLVLHQGWKRQIKQMFEQINIPLISLKRVRQGKLQLGDLAAGKSRVIKRSDII